MSFNQNMNSPNKTLINNLKQNPNPPVGLLSSTYDPSRQISSMKQTLKNTSQHLQTPQSYPKPAIINSGNMNYNNNGSNSNRNSNSNQYRAPNPFEQSINTSTKNTNNINDTNKSSSIINSHPSQSGRVPPGLPVHPNSREGEQIRNQQKNAVASSNSNSNSNSSSNNSIINNNSLIESVSNKIYNHFKAKYPATIDASTFSKSTVTTIITHTIKKEPLNEKTIGKIIDIIDHKFKTTINSDNRQGVQYDTTNFAMDTESKISIDKYLENYTNKVSILLDNSDKAIEADLPKKMAPINEQVTIDPPEPFSEDFPIRDRAKQTDMMTPELREYDYYIIINSNDRNVTKYPDANSFVIDFAPAPSGDSPQKGYVDKTFSNIKSCELLNVVIFNTSSSSSSSIFNGASYPYLLLQCDELQNNYYGTNNTISKSFAVLTNSIDSGDYKYYRIFGDSGSDTVTKVYNPRINLTKLTTRLLLPNGNPYQFGNEFTNDTSNSCISFGFRIKTIQKLLATSFINNA